jgi:hypothetical protein
MSDPLLQSNNIVIGEGVTFTGTITAPGKAMINGEVTGNLTASDLHIGEAGQVSGVIRAKEINVHGKLSKDIVCQQHVMISLYRSCLRYVGVPGDGDFAWRTISRCDETKSGVHKACNLSLISVDGGTLR